jgi:putative endonuclease
MYQVYILKSAAGRSYIGVTEDVETRLAQHNSGVSTWTRGKGPWVLDWLSRPLDLGEARKLENLLKRQKGGAGLQKLKTLHGS